MKRFIISAALFTFVLSLSAQGNSTAEAQSAIVYALPKTELSVDVEIEKTTLKPGVTISILNDTLPPIR
jgi:protein involved in polysaccharide export with SLBB domain